MSAFASQPNRDPRSHGPALSAAVSVAGCGDRTPNQAAGENCDEGQNTAVCDDDCTFPACGDGVHNPEATVVGAVHTEQCDDGGGNSDTQPNACRTDCRAPSCGDLVVDDALLEQCDPGAAGDLATCDADCTLPACGDGHANAVLEQCDPGDADGVPGADDAPTCDSDCTLPRCGDAHVNATVNDATADLGDGEACDEDLDADGDADDTATCDRDCTAVVCGDEYANLAAGERCDQGAANSERADAVCRTDCLWRRCGDGVLDAGEQCDDPVTLGDPDGDGVAVDTPACDHDCTDAVCGDAYINAAASEQCDDGTAANSDQANATCRTDCRPQRCGDGIVDTAPVLAGSAPEQCDDGADNADAPDQCRTSCQAPTCGDAIVDPGNAEQCDDGTANSDFLPDACRQDCRAAYCGDGVKDTGEECDTGVNNSDDLPNSCRTDCRLPYCGDGVLDSLEPCDPGDGTNGGVSCPVAGQTCINDMGVCSC